MAEAERLHVEEAAMVVEVTIGEAMIVATLLEVVIVEVIEADQEDMHHTDAADHQTINLG